MLCFKFEALLKTTIIPVSFQGFASFCFNSPCYFSYYCYRFYFCKLCMTITDLLKFLHISHFFSSLAFCLTDSLQETNHQNAAVESMWIDFTEKYEDNAPLRERVSFIINSSLLWRASQHRNTRPSHSRQPSALLIKPLPSCSHFGSDSDSDSDLHHFKHSSHFGN